MYTYINDQDIKRWSKVEDPEVNELFQEARQKEPDILISTHTRYVKKLFRKTKRKTFYSVMFKIGYEARIVNFYLPNDSSINSNVSKTVIINYLYGLITGLNFSQDKTAAP